MKRNIFNIVLILFFVFLSGCTITEIDEIDEIDYDTFAFNHTANSNNINQFYELTNIFNTTQQGFELEVVLTPKVEVASKNLKVNGEYVIKYSISGDEESKYDTHTFLFDFSSKERFSKKLIITMPESSSNYELFSLNIKDVEGNIYSNQNTYENINKSNYDKLVSTMGKFDNVEEYNYVFIESNVETKYTKGKFTNVDNQYNFVKMRNSPFYLETDDQKVVYKEENGAIFSYKLSSSKINDVYWITKEKIGDSLNIDQYFNYDELLGSSDFEPLDINYEKINIEVENNKFILTGKYKDLLPKEQFDAIQDIYIMMGLNESILSNATFKLTIIINEKSIEMETYTIFLVNNDMFDSLETTTIITMNFEEFNTIDFNDKEKYYIIKPGSFDKVYEYTNVLEDIESIESYARHYYLTHLEAGQYYINDYSNTLYIEIYNSKKEKVNLGDLFGRTNNYQHNKTFTLPKGDYYISIHNYQNRPYKFSLKPLNYKDIYDFNNPIVIKEGTLNFEIEGQYDLYVTNYVSDVKGVLKVTNNTNINAKLYYKDGSTTDYCNEVFGDGRFYEIVEGNNYFYFYGAKQSYSYTIEFIKADPYKSKSNLVEITETDEWIITGPKIKYSYFKLEVKEQGKFTFNFEKYNTHSDYLQISIYDSITDTRVKSVDMFQSTIELPKGSYYILAGSYRVGVSKFSYEFVKTN